MPTTLTRDRQRQGGYLSKTCPYKIALDNMPATYPEDLKEPLSVFMQDLFEGGNTFEEHIGTRLLAEVPAGELAYIVEARGENGERTRDGKRAKEEDTFAAYLNPQVRVIFNARIGPRFEQLLSMHLGEHRQDPDRISEPDLIELGDAMPTGLRAMRFIDVKWHKITTGKSVHPKEMPISLLSAPYKDHCVGRRAFYGTIHQEDWRQLAHYYRHAQRLGLTQAERDGGAWAGVIGKEEVVVWADLDQISFSRRTALQIYDADFADGLAVVDNATVRDTNPDIPALAFPEWKGDCKECEWRAVCKGQLLAHGNGGHITLLPGITPSRAKPLYARGITDVATLAAQDEFTCGPDVPAPFVYTARVALDGRPHLALDVDELDLPRADIEVDFDCESESTVYMWGVRVTEHTGDGDLVSEHMLDDYSRTEDGERAVFVKLWALFAQLSTDARARHRSIALYHYTAYERTQMRGLARKYAGLPGVPTEEDVQALFDSGAVVDLYEVLSKQIVWPTLSHSIKKLAVFAGFSWRDETPGGDMSMVWYRAACADPDPQVRAANMQRLRMYNLDDVHAQAYLRDYATGNPLEPVTNLTAPPMP